MNTTILPINSPLTSTSVKFNSTIVIEHFPSRSELCYLINAFLSKIESLKEYELTNQQNRLRITFQSQDTAYQVLSYLTQLPFNNQLYSRLKCYLLIEPNPIIKPQSNVNTNGNVNPSLILNTSPNVSRNPLNKSIKSTSLSQSSDMHLSQSQIDNQRQRMKTQGSKASVSTSTSVSVSLSGSLLSHNRKRNVDNESRHRRYNTSNDIEVNEDYIHKHFSDIRSKAGIMSTASPYLTEEEKMKIEEKKSKEKNISNKDFRPFVGIATTRRAPYIKNYVTTTPSDNILNILFRKEDQKKWICKQKFWI